MLSGRCNRNFLPSPLRAFLKCTLHILENIAEKESFKKIAPGRNLWDQILIYERLMSKSSKVGGKISGIDLREIGFFLPLLKLRVSHNKSWHEY